MSEPFIQKICEQCGGSLHLVGREMTCGVCGMPVAAWEKSKEADRELRRKYARIPAAVVCSGLTGPAQPAIPPAQQPSQPIQIHGGGKRRRD